MQKHIVNLTDKEFRLFDLIHKTDDRNKRKDDMIELFIRQMELFSETASYTPKTKWLQIGDKSCFQTLNPVKPKKDAPLASDIIVEQRKGSTGKYQ